MDYYFKIENTYFQYFFTGNLLLSRINTSKRFLYAQNANKVVVKELLCYDEYSIQIAKEKNCHFNTSRACSTMQVKNNKCRHFPNLNLKLYSNSK